MEWGSESKRIKLVRQTHNILCINKSDLYLLLSYSIWVYLNTDTLSMGSSDDENSGTFSVLDIEKLNSIYKCSGK